MKRTARVLTAFGKALKKFRLAAGLSQEDLAELADLHRTYVGDVERGERNVSLINIPYVGSVNFSGIHHQCGPRGTIKMVE